MTIYGEKNIKLIAKILRREVADTFLKWVDLQLLAEPKKTITKPRWSQEEDKLLELYVVIYGEGKWSRIADHIPNRTGKQCRERWTS
jgi:hypothetical protein